MSAPTVLMLAALIALLVAALPTWSYSREWGLGRAGAAGTVLLALAVAAALGGI